MFNLFRSWSWATNKSREYKPRVDDNGVPLPRSERKPKKKVAVLIGYCGTGYNGMQIQNNPDVKTIEGELFKAFVSAGAVSPENSDDLKKNGFMRCARTDKGVHAAGNVVSLKMIIEDPDLMKNINSHLPEHIRIWGIQRVGKSFDCRKMCSSRVYEYLLPTHTLLPPKPHTILADMIADHDKAAPGIARADDEGETWWRETAEALAASELSSEQIGEIEAQLRDPATSNSSIKTHEEDGSLTELGTLMKVYKGIENQRRRAYAVSPERLALFREAMGQYEGTHNFHNFTLGKHFRDPSASRYIIGTTVSEPFVIEGTEWVSVKIHGQSFMLHQIRKMIAMAVLVVRTKCPISRIADCFGPTNINVPKAPALGLLLENPVFDGCNAVLEKLDYEKIEFSKFSAEMDAFKRKFIYDKIYAEEVKENTFHSFFSFIDNFTTPVSRDEPEEKAADEKAELTKKAEVKHVFDFLGATFDSGKDASVNQTEK